MRSKVHESGSSRLDREFTPLNASAYGTPYAEGAHAPRPGTEQPRIEQPGSVQESAGNGQQPPYTNGGSGSHAQAHLQLDGYRGEGSAHSASFASRGYPQQDRSQSDYSPRDFSQRDFSQRDFSQRDFSSPGRHQLDTDFRPAFLSSGARSTGRQNRFRQNGLRVGSALFVLILGLVVGGAFLGAGGRNPLESVAGHDSASERPEQAVPFADESRGDAPVELGGAALPNDRYGTAGTISGAHRGARQAAGGGPAPAPDLTQSNSTLEVLGGQLAGGPLLAGGPEGGSEPGPLAPRQTGEERELARTERVSRGAQPVSGLVREPSGAQRIGGYYPLVTDLGRISFTDDSQGIAVTPSGDRLMLTLDQELQLKARQMLQRYQVPWGAIVAIDPKTGKVLTLASYSEREPFGTPVALRASFPAASLFKIITAAAAIERSGITARNIIAFRGGNYTLGPYNALPDSKKDRRFMSVGEAMGKSVNPVFARVALNYLNPAMMERYAESFGFNSALAFDVPLEMSTFLRPETDYDTARTAAGFGPVTLSPLHAAAFTAAIANDGVMMRPFLIERAYDSGGNLKYTAHPSALRTVVTRSTATELREMMVETVTSGTARRHFFKVKNPLLKSGLAAAKTGTLSGTNPKGVYHWFVAAAPADEPQVAIATLVIDPGGARVKSAALGREFLEYYFRTPGSDTTIEPAGGTIRLVSPRRKARTIAAKKSSTARVRRAKRRKR